MVNTAGGPDSASAMRASLAKTAASRCAETKLCWGARSATTATTGRTMDAVAAKWNADGTAVRASAQGYAETGCARVQKSVTTGTRLRGMDAAGTAWWRWGTHAAGPRRAGNAGDLATRAWEDAEMARGRKGRQRNAMMETTKTGTGVAEHVRLSVAGSVWEARWTVPTLARRCVETRRCQGSRSATTGIQRAATGAHHRA
jgi:hypothetical protein